MHFWNLGDAEWRSGFLLSSALWSVCGFPIAVSSRHFGSFIPPARQSGKSWQGRLNYWVMKIINQQPPLEFIFFFSSFLVSGERAAGDPLSVGLRLHCGCSQCSTQITLPQRLLSLHVELLQIKMVIYWDKGLSCARGSANKDKEIIPDPLYAWPRNSSSEDWSTSDSRILKLKGQK